MALRIGLLSSARINALLVGGAAGVPAVEVVAAGSRTPERARAHADELGLERAHGSYEALLGDPDVDAVYVALPNSLHLEWSVRALRAGKHVLCEKPMSRDPSAVERAHDVAEAEGLVLAEGFMWRHAPQAARLVELASELGGVRMVRAAFSFPLDAPGDPRMQAGLEGGALMDVGCYCLSAVRLLCGEPESVMAVRRTGGDGVDVSLAAVMKCADGALAHFDCSFELPPRGELEVVGSQASLHLPDPWHSRHPLIERRAEGGPAEVIRPEFADPYACELRDFAAAAAGKESLPFGRADAVAQARALAALHESAVTGRAVRIAPAQEPAR